MNYAEFAEDYLNLGLNAIPLLDNKAPAMPRNPLLKEELKYDDIPALFNKAKKIGVACGKVSGNMLAIDFDGHKGEDIRSVFSDFIQIPHVKTLIRGNKVAVYKTPSGGFHVIFKTEKSEPTRPLAKWPDGSVMIETRGEGAYICCFPSPGYKHLKGCTLTTLVTIDHLEMEALIMHSKSYSAMIVDDKQQNTSGKLWGEGWKAETPDGRYNIYHQEEALDLLIQHDWQIVEKPHWLHDTITRLTRPGKDAKDGISATYGWQPGLFYVFTSSVLEFKQGGKYTPFDIFTILTHGGDWKAAKDALRDRFGMEKFSKPEAPSFDLDDSDDEPDPERIHFPLHVFPEALANFIKVCNRTLNFSEDFMACATMSVMSGLMGNQFKVRVKNGWNAPLIFWFAVIGEPGTLKSHPLSLAFKPVREIDKINKRYYDGQMEDFKEYERQVKENPKLKVEEVRKPSFRQVIITDYTIEALYSIHDFNKRGVSLYRDELVGFLNDMDKYRKGSDEQFWLESFNNTSYTVNRVSKEPILLSNICINIIGTMQPDVLFDVAQRYTGNGLLDRFLFTEAENRVVPINKENMPSEWFDWWNEVCKIMDDLCDYKHEQDEIIFEFTDDAFERFIEIDEWFCALQLSPETSMANKSYLSKMKTYMPRFALLVSLMDGFIDGKDPNKVVTREQLERAFEIIQYFMKTGAKVFSDVSISKEMGNVAKGMNGKSNSEMIIELKSKGFTNSAIAKKVGVSRQYVGNVVKSAKKV